MKRWLVLLIGLGCGAASSPAQIEVSTSHAGVTMTGAFVADTPGEEQPAAIKPVESAGALLLDAGDLLEVQVFDTPELSGKMRVDEEGEITLPIGGAVKVKGLTAAQAQGVVEARLRERDILHEPHVEILVLEYATQGVTIMGEVRVPGFYPLRGKHTVMDLITVAGGFTSSASRVVHLTHKDSPTQAVTVDLSSDLGNVAASQFQVEPGDRIAVGRSGLVYVVGDVGRPGGYPIDNSKNIITVLQALALAQGVNKTAKLDAKLIRTSPAGRSESDLPLKKILANQVSDPPLQDGDILFVPVSGTKQWADKGVTSILQMAVGVVIYGRL